MALFNLKIRAVKAKQPEQKWKPIRYADVGVHIAKANHFVRLLIKRVRPLDQEAKGGDIGGFAALRNISDELKGNESPVLVMTTDGVGTKLELAHTSEHHRSIGIDLVAMCVNDLICSGAKPLFFLDYYATGKLSLGRANAFVAGLLDGCHQAGCSLVGGETAEMPGFYSEDKYDVAGFCVGLADRNKLIRLRAKPGSLLIGLPSSGVHANGFSLVRRLIAVKRLDPSKRINIGGERTSIKKALIKPTQIYVNAIKEVVNRVDLQGIAHITGGGIIGNLRRILPEGVGASIERDTLNDLPTAPLFRELQAAAVLKDWEMMRTFNCGIGMILALEAKDEREVLETLSDGGERPRLIGKITAGNSIRLV